MLYCPPNVSLSEVWVNHGFSVCFYETVTSSEGDYELNIKFMSHKTHEIDSFRFEP